MAWAETAANKDEVAITTLRMNFIVIVLVVIGRDVKQRMGMAGGG